MADERWDRIEALFDEALDLPAADLPGWLDRVDAGLRPELKALLEAHAASAGFLEAPAAAGAADLVEEGLPGEGPPGGRQIGPYRLGPEIGRGGMGVVYRARRDDVDLDVAIKLLAGAVPSRGAVRRFLAERRVLARLEHPNVARLLDAGVTPGGGFHFVMEFVDGRPIDVYCDENRLGIDERLRLFVHLCEAVEAAHRQLVVHRDLKPSNVLVTPDGIVKLLDFGIAKVLEDEPVAGGSDAAATVTRIMTPQYASPEQIRGESVGTATDVYSLGGLLYRLLAGRAPYEIDTSSLFEASRIILETEPDRPSQLAPDPGTDTGPEEIARRRSTTRGRLEQRLRGDLDVIVAEAMRKSPAQRYPSVAALREDIERHLGGHPVRARGDSFGYRAGRFLRRNAVGVAVGAVALVATLGAGWYHTRTVAGERDAAKLEAEKAERVTGFLVELLTGSDPDRAAGEDPTATELLRRGSERIRAELEDQAEVRGAVLDALGVVQRKRGDYAEAEVLLEEALDLRRATYGEEHVEVAESLDHLASLRADQSDWAGAEAHQREAYELSRRVRGERAPQTVYMLHNLGIFVMRQGDLERAEPILRQSLEERRRLLPAGHTGIAHGVGILANLLRDLGRFEEAAELYAESAELTRAAYGDDHPRLASVLHNLARMHFREGRLEEADREYLEALEIRQQVYGARNPRLVSSYLSLSTLRSRTGQSASAESLYAQGLSILVETHGPDHPKVAMAWRTGAVIALEAGRDAVADSLARLSLDSVTRLLGRDDAEWAKSVRALADVRLAQGRAGEAVELLGEVVAVSRERFGEGSAQHVAALRERVEAGRVAGEDAAADADLAEIRALAAAGHEAAVRAVEAPEAPGEEGP